MNDALALAGRWQRWKRRGALPDGRACDRSEDGKLQTCPTSSALSILCAPRYSDGRGGEEGQLMSGSAAAETILIVDDEAPVRQTFAGWLREADLGVTVLTAGDTATALQQANDHVIDLA